jgi:uncharacterized repeat protein (TIGR01451 family)
MASRGIWHVMSARTRRSLALTWGALFVLSLLLQYFSFAVAQPVLAAHDEGLFELDGNALDSAGTAGDDWNSTNNADDDVFIGAGSEAAGNDTTYFTGGGSKDVNDIDEWSYTANDVAPDKDDILDAYAAAYQKDGETFVYFGADRFDGSGDAFIGFWFFQNAVGLGGGGNFTGTHEVGDVLVVSDFTNGGSISEIKIYEWDGNGLDLVAEGAECDVPGDHEACAVVNADTEDAPWPYTDKDGGHDFAAGAFYEGGINLDDIFPNGAPCFSGFLAETRSSQSTSAQLKDFALGSLSTCAPPDIETQVSDSTVDFGGTVTDTATLTGDSGEVTGSVEFFLCGPADGNPNCANGGTQIGDAVTLVDGEATSDEFTVPNAASAVGDYCFRVEYTPDASAEYLAAEHTNRTTECFTVEPATIDVTKTADAASVSAGEEIGFTVTLENTGTGTATGVEFTDALPGGDGINWSISPASAGWSISGTAPNQSLVYSPTTLAGGASTSVHVVSDTTAESCATYDNTASVTTTSDGEDSASASVVVNCPDIAVEKTAGTSPISVGGTAEFTITVTNIGAGTAFDVVLEDELPGGLDWSDDSADCTIAGDTLTCDIGDLAPDASFSVTVSANTDTEASETEDCGPLPNLAEASAGNEPSDALENNSDDAVVNVACTSGLEILKSVTGNTGGTDPILNVPQAEIGDTLTYTLEYTGVGPITNAVITDVLPVGLEYVDGSAAGDANFTFVAYDDATRTLTWTAATLPDPANGTVTYQVLVLEAAAEEVQPLINVATIDSDETDPDDDTASVAVLAPPLGLTPPPTSTLSPETGTSNPGFALMLVLLGVAGLALGIGFITPVPERARRR